MKTKIIQIGNSKGLRLSQTMLRQYQINEEVELEMREEGILIKPTERIRKNWEQQFKDAIVNEIKADKSVLEIRNTFDKEEWTW